MLVYLFYLLPGALALFKNVPRPDAISTVFGPLDVNCSVSVCEGPLAPIYCHGEIIAVAYQFGVESWCPGKQLLFSPDAVVENFKKLDYPISKETFVNFCEKNFNDVDFLIPTVPHDWSPNPGHLQNITDLKYRRLAKFINERWRNLTRRFSDEVIAQPDRYPAILVKNPFVVPGGFFDVYYYWDTYWINKGLLHSGMVETVKGIIDNYAFLVETLGHIPNGGFIYLQRRSQPPMFVQMVADYFDYTKDIESLKRWSTAMDSEMKFWLTQRSIQEGDARSMYRYRADSDCPRPENFLSDFRLGKLSQNSTATWRSMASACESGWDFSSRWFKHTGQSAFEKATIHTDEIIPVDLNVFMVLNFRTMSKFKRILNDAKFEKLYVQIAEELAQQIHHYMWNNTEGAWMDLHIKTLMHRVAFYPSNVYPLMILNTTSVEISKVKQYLYKNKVLDFPGGIPTTLPSKSREQWDFPNVWAPNQHLFIMSLWKTGDTELFKAGISQARRFVSEVYNGLFDPADGQKSGIWEKYNATTSDGRAGGGGEYPVQEGFGWTNGAVLDLIVKLENVAIPKENALKGESKAASLSPHVYFIGSLLTFLVCLALLFLFYGFTNNMQRYGHLRGEEAGSSSRVSLLTEEH